MYQLIDGKALANEIFDELSREIQELLSIGKKRPQIRIIHIGNDSASKTYVEGKLKACKRVGILCEVINLESAISEDNLLEEVIQLNNNADIDGYIVQLPLPIHINEHVILSAIEPKKDIDGAHPMNTGLMTMGLPCFLPATPFGIMLMLEKYKIETSGKNCVIIGRSHIVGSPMSILLSRNSNPGNCTVTLCHSKTHNISNFTKSADILIVALGKQNFVTADMVKKGAIVIDVGIHRSEMQNEAGKYKISGDVKFDEVAPLCSYITPVPGGVGPMTIASLLKNTLQAAKNKY